MSDYLEMIEQAVSAWEGITSNPHRFGGKEFKVGKQEIGHLHRGGLVDIPFTRKVKDELLREGKASNHHVLPESGWISFWVRSEADAQHAIWLFRLSYLHKLAARRGRGSIQAIDASDAELQQEIGGLRLSAVLRSLLASFED